MIKNILLLLCSAWWIGCFDPANNNSDEYLNASTEATGDAKAIALANRIIAANGGKENWDKVPYISFDYFGRRYWFWDKVNNRYRLESEKRNLRAAGKLDGSETNLWLRGEIITDADSISKYKDFAYKAWINDTYWLIFPFKLMDPGVKLKYVGDCMADSVTSATCMEMTFEKVGVTPENKYIVYVDTVKNEIIHWDYFEKYTDTLPAVSNPWNDYRQYGDVRISGGRGDDTLKQIAVHSILPDEIFRDVSKPFRDILNK